MDKRIFLSYCWNDTAAANRLDNLFSRFGVPLTRDTRDLAYNACIHDFMDTIKQHDQIILYVSDSYLHSINCMYEASQTLDMQERVVVIIKDGTHVFGAQDKLDLLRYWETQLLEISKMDPVEFRQEIKDVETAYRAVGAFVDFIKKDNRMNDKSLDFDALLSLLGVEKQYPLIMTPPVYAWIASYPEAKLFDLLALIGDLYGSTWIELSAYPNIPENEAPYRFGGIRFDREMDGINLILSVTEKQSGLARLKTYPHLVGIEENTMRSDRHAKYYFYCENLAKKQRWMELRDVHQYRSLDAEEMRLFTEGYRDVYRIIIHF